MNTISEEQVLHNELSFEINQELIHLMKRIIEIQKQNKELKDNWNKLKEWLEEEITNDKCCTDLITHCLSIQDLIDEKQYILDKMQEIEGGMNE